MTLCTSFTLGLALFCCCLAVHIGVWRLCRNRSLGMALVVIFLFLPGILIALFLGAKVLFPDALPGVRPVEWGMAYILNLSLSGSYFFVYTAVAGFSPSIGILEKVDASMPRGLKRHELAPDWFTDANLSGARLRNLMASGLVTESDGSLRLSSRGRVIAQGYLVFRRFLGLGDLAQG